MYKQIWAEMGIAISDAKSVPSFFRRIDTRMREFESSKAIYSTPQSELKKIMDALLSNDLYFNPQSVSGEGKFLDYFLCISITDEELPWDIEAEIW